MSQHHKTNSLLPGVGLVLPSGSEMLVSATGATAADACSGARHLLPGPGALAMTAHMLLILAFRYTSAAALASSSP